MVNNKYIKLIHIYIYIYILITTYLKYNVSISYYYLEKII